MALFLSKNLTFKYLLLVSILTYVSALCAPDSSHGPINSTSELAALNRINSLQGLTWSVDSYTVGICTAELLKVKAGGVILTTSKESVVIGRTNHTHAVFGDNWVLIIYRGGDMSTVPRCKGNFTSEIIIVCDHSQTTQGELRVVEEDGCITRFELKSITVCSPESPSTWSLIFVWIIFIFSLYCIAGIVYRRFKLRVQGRQQLPNLAFWSKIGAGCADCCNWVCRCEEETAATWDADTDRDDVLLRP